jgi:hypothetical protein
VPIYHPSTTPLLLLLPPCVCRRESDFAWQLSVPIHHPTTTLLLLLLLLCVRRRESDFAWQLSVPIYHPTTTLLLAVFTDAGRGKLQCLGKLQYRISYLMYLNHRWVA